MNMNSKPMNEFIYEPKLHEYEYEYRTQFMKHDEYIALAIHESHELYEPK